MYSALPVNPNLANSAVLLARSEAGVEKIEDAFEKELIVSASGTASKLNWTVLKNTLGMKFKIVSGYQGSNESLLAIMRGEADACLGSRFAAADEATLRRTPHYWPNKLLNALVNRVNSLALTDFNTLVEKRDWGANLARDLARADLALKPSEFLAIRAGAIIGLPAAVFLLGSTVLPAIPV